MKIPMENKTTAERLVMTNVKPGTWVKDTDLDRAFTYIDGDWH